MKTYYTVDQISKMLNMHPKTIQRYIREGKLNATKFGKGWRVAGHDLSAFTENNPNLADTLDTPPKRHIIASSVIDIHTSNKEEAIRIMNTLTATMNVKPSEYGQSSLQSQYIERDNMVRITLWGDIRFMTIIMDTIMALTD